VVFILLYLILRKVAWGPMLEGLHKREESIFGALNEAEKARAEAAREGAPVRPAPGKDPLIGPRPQRVGAASFSEQLSVAKAKDPLLERITRAPK
jgi:hypothetical protein